MNAARTAMCRNRVDRSGGDNEGGGIGTQLGSPKKLNPPGPIVGQAALLRVPEVVNRRVRSLFRGYRFAPEVNGGKRLRYVVALRKPPLASMKPTMRSSPSLFFRLVITKGRSPRILLASVCIFSREAPTWGARSILLMTRRSDRVMPGPPLDGILSPAATSMT